MKTPTPELRDLLDRLMDEGGLSRPEMGRLEELMSDPEVMEYCCEALLNESLLAEGLQTMGSAVREAEVAAPPRWTRLRDRVARLFPMAAAAGIAFAAGYLVAGRQTAPGHAVGVAPSARTAAPAARVTGMMGVVWEGDSTPTVPDSPADAQRFAFTNGLVELTYASGVRVTLEGPADYTVSDRRSGRMAAGKLVAYVPKGAEGFTVDFGGGQVVDLGTEFAMELGRNGKMELGVFEGEVELHLPGDSPLLLNRSQAMVHDRNAEEPLRPVPFDRRKFVRELPNRDFLWSIHGSDPVQLELDVSHLVFKSAEYRAIFKWRAGKDGVEIRDVELRQDGRRVAADPRRGQTGVLLHVKDNLFDLTVPAGSYQPGRWTLHATITQLARVGGLKRSLGAVDSSGIVLFEEGLVNRAEAADFIGCWSYSYGGARFVREFRADGSITVTRNGKLEPRAFSNCSWWVDKGVLHAEVPGGDGLVELHVLRDRDTLIFTNRAYDNATRLEGAAGGG